MQENIAMGNKKSAVTAIHEKSGQFHRIKSKSKSKSKVYTVNPEISIKQALGKNFVEKSKKVSPLLNHQSSIEWKLKIQTNLKKFISSNNKIKNSSVSNATGENKKETIEKEEMMDPLISPLDFPLPSHEELENTVQDLLKESNLERQITELDIELPKNVTLEQVKRTLRKLSKQISESADCVPEFAVEEKDDEMMTSTQIKTVGNISTEKHDPPRASSFSRKVKSPPKLMDMMAKRAKPAPASSSSAKLIGSEIHCGKIWQKFSALSPWKKLAAVVVLAVVYATVGMVAGQLLSLAFPALTQGIFREFFIDYAVESLRNRSEVNYSLLQLSAEQARPLSRAWRDQFVLCKHI